MDTSAQAYRDYGGGDLEESFYKVYYHLLFQNVRWLSLEEPDSNVLVLLDNKRNRHPFRPDVLKRTLNAGLKRELKKAGLVANVEPRQSSGRQAEPLIQLVDVLIGAIGFVRNGRFSQPGASPARVQMVNHLQEQAGTSFAITAIPWRHRVKRKRGSFAPTSPGR